MKVEQSTPIWTQSSPTADASSAAQQSKVGVVDRVERGTDGFERKISVQLPAIQKQQGQNHFGPRIGLKLFGARGRDGVLYRPGYPEVPAMRFFVAAENKEDIRVRLGSEMQLEERVVVSTCQPSVPKSGQTPEMVPSADFSGFYPPVRFEVEEAGSLNGKTQYMVSVYPVAVTKTGEVSVIPSFDISAKKPEGATVETRVKNGAEKTFAFVVGEQFADSPSLQAYKELKEQSGFRVETILIGRDANSPEDIRAKLQQYYQSPERDLQHALIIGDFEDVPAPQSQYISGVTDHYYRAIDTTGYDSDINGPDIGVGRLPVRDEAQLAGVIGKLTQYAKNDFADKAWQGNVSFLATNDQWEVAEGTHNYAIDKYTKADGLLGTYPNDMQPGGDKLYAITHRAEREDVKKAFAEGRALVDYSGHGAHTYWDAPNFTQADVREMAHPDARPFVISNACITGDFEKPEAFAETWILHPQGASMFWGSVDSTYWTEDDVLEKAMFDGIYQLQKQSFAEITQHALHEHWRYNGGAGRSKYYWETYTTFGDPSLKLLLQREEDDIPPATPMGMQVAEAGPMSCRVQLTATGDDGWDGRAAAYDVRISDKPIVAGEPGPGQVSFEDAAKVPTASPAASGEVDSIPVPYDPATESRRMYVALKVMDNVGNASDMVTRDFIAPPVKMVFEDGPDAFDYDGSWGRVDVDGRTGVWTDSPDGNYGDNANTSLTTKVIDLSDAKDAMLQFAAKHDLESGFDFGRVFIAEAPATGEEPVRWSEHEVFKGNSGWKDYRIDLAAYEGKQIRIRFALESDPSVTRDGLYVDDVQVVAAAESHFGKLVESVIANRTISAAEAQKLRTTFRDAVVSGAPILDLVMLREALLTGIDRAEAMTARARNTLYGPGGPLAGDFAAIVNLCETAREEGALSPRNARAIRTAFKRFMAKKPGNALVRAVRVHVRNTAEQVGPLSPEAKMMLTSRGGPMDGVV